MQSGSVNKDANRAELDSLRSEWRAALLAARAALSAEEDVLDPAELAAHDRHLRLEYKAAGEELRQFALDEGLSPALAEPFLPRGLARRALGLPANVRSCVFELDDEGLAVARRALSEDDVVREACESCPMGAISVVQVEAA